MSTTTGSVPQAEGGLGSGASAAAAGRASRGPGRSSSLIGRLHVQLVVVVAGLLSLAFLATAMLMRAGALDAARETIQRQNLGLAMSIAMMLERDLIDIEGRADVPLMRELARNVMKINPALEIYLLDARGRVLAHALDRAAAAFAPIDIGPVRRLAIPSIAPPRLPLLGDDPMRPGRQGVFSATVLGAGVEPAGYLYVMLDGTREESATRFAAPDTLNGLLLGVLSVSVLLGFVSVWVLRSLTRPLERLTRDVQRFDERDASTALSPRPSGSAEVRDLHRAVLTMQKRIVEQVKSLRARDRSRRELIGNVSHDLRTPLANIRGYVETLQLEGPALDEAERHRALSVIARQAESMNRHVTALFELSKLEAGAVELAPTHFALAELAQDVAMGLSPPTKDRESRIVFDPGTDPDAWVYADIGLIERALQNLIDNALRHSPPDEPVRVSLRIDERVGSPAQVVVRVSNGGPGIAPHDMPRIFDRFWCADAGCENASERPGSGLGLAIVRRIVKLHGTSIRVSSKPGVRTVFEFGLPRVSQDWD